MELDVERRRAVGSTDSPADPTPVVCVCVRVCARNDCVVSLQTRQLVAGVMERARLLLSVTIARSHTPSLSSYTSTEEESRGEHLSHTHTHSHTHTL